MFDALDADVKILRVGFRHAVCQHRWEPAVFALALPGQRWFGSCCGVFGVLGADVAVAGGGAVYDYVPPDWAPGLCAVRRAAASLLTLSISLFVYGLPGTGLMRCRGISCARPCSVWPASSLALLPFLGGAWADAVFAGGRVCRPVP